ncbi:MAG: S8 family serine peptidase [Candidatus Bathyarchaeia archaeon]
MKRKIFWIISATVLALLLSTPIFATPQFEGIPHRYTWDADMINSDITGYTGKGLYVAVLDTGLAPNWRDYFPEEKIAAHLGKGFKENIIWDSKTGTFRESGVVHETSFIGCTGSTHGTHVTSTIIGYYYYAPADELSGLALPPIYVEGIAPDVTIIPIKVLADYHIGKRHLNEDYDEMHMVFGTDRMVAAGIRYATNLKIAGYSPMIITMSLGGSTPSPIIEDAINYAIANGVIVVAAAGNEGELGMSWPGAYPQVISVGACGWKYEWYWPGTTPPPPRYRLWWLQDETYGYNDIPEPTPANDVYITDWSSREKEGQDLDVVAPGSWVRGPYPGTPGYSHLPWWSNGWGWLVGANPGNFYYLGGTSMATPHVAAVIAQILEKNPTLTQIQVEYILKTTALSIAPGSMSVYDLSPTPGWYTYSWGNDATGSGLVQADAAVALA